MPLVDHPTQEFAPSFSGANFTAVSRVLPLKGGDHANLLNDRGVVHVRFDGRSLDVELDELNVGPNSDDRTIKHALAQHLDVPERDLGNYVVDRHDTGNLTIRPSAVFG